MSYVPGIGETVLNYPALWLSFVIPLISGFISLFVGNKMSGKAHTILAVSSWILALLVVLPAFREVLSGATVVDPIWSTLPGIGTFSLVLDGVSAPVALSVVFVSMLIAWYSYPYMLHRFHELGRESWGLYFALYQFFTAGMLGAALASNGVLFYLFLELTLIPSAVLIILYGYGDRLRVGLIYLVWTHIGALLLLLGLFIIGVYDFYVPGKGYAVAVSSSLLALTLIVVGLGVKSAYAGLHLWLPYAHAEAPTPVSALLSPLLIGLGGYALVRAGLGFFNGVWGAVSWILLLWALATMFYGGFLVLVQKDTKRLFAYSSVSQMGYMLLGLAVANREGITGSILHYAAHAYGKAILFGTAGVLIALVGTRKLEELGGLARRLPLTASIALIGFMLISGLPPTLGLWSEVYLVFGYARWAHDLTSTLFALGAVAVIAAMTLTVIYSFQAFRRMFLGEFGPAAARVTEHVEKEHADLIAPLIIIGFIGALFFIAIALLADPLAQLVSAVYAA